jgi:hypothetical protein
MNLSLGDGLTIMSILSFILAIAYRILPPKKSNCNTTNATIGQCADHLNIATEQATIKATLKNVEYGVEELREGQESIRDQLTKFIERFIQV